MSYGAVFRIVEISDPKNAGWSSRPYETKAAANNRASYLNNEEARKVELYNDYDEPRHFVVEVLEGDWERA